MRHTLRTTQLTHCREKAATDKSKLKDLYLSNIPLIKLANMLPLVQGSHMYNLVEENNLEIVGEHTPYIALRIIVNNMQRIIIGFSSTFVNAA